MRRRWRSAAAARWRWIVGAVVAVVTVVWAASYLVGIPLRGELERRMNAALSGYHVQLGAVALRPLGLGVALHDLTIVQDATPDTPIAKIPSFTTTVQWKALVFGRLVADLAIDRPELRIDRREAEQEAKDEVPVHQRGWQQAIEAIYPLKINRIRIRDGALTYVEAGPLRPIRMTNLQVRASNIRNVHSPDRTYPSEFHVRATLLDSTPLTLDGRADFLAEPFAAVKAQMDLGQLRLDYLKPVLARYNVTVRKGTLSMAGDVEYGPKVQDVHLAHLDVHDVDLDYVHTQATAPVEAERAEAGAKAAKKVAEQPKAIVVRADRIEVTNGTFGYVDRSTDPPYRVFLDTKTLLVHDFSNQIRENTAKAKLRGALMGTGTTSVDGTFRSETHGPDFDLTTRIEGVDMTKMNDVWRAYGGFDVAAGQFAFYSEMHVRNRRVDGYVKPLFEDVDVYDPQQDANKGLPQKIYEGVVGGVTEILSNRSEDAVATRTNISGTLDNPNTSTWQAIVGLVENAFFNSVLPGLERERR